LSGWRAGDPEISVGRIERGSVNLTLSTLLRLCEMFELELPQLFSFIDTGKETLPEREKLIVRLNSVLQNNDPEEIRKLRIFIDEIL